MPTLIQLPNLGENIKAGEVITVLVKVGDSVRAEQGVLELETDKAVVEVPCGKTGRVLEILARVGERIEVGAAILRLEESDTSEAPPPKQDAPVPAAPETAPPLVAPETTPPPVAPEAPATAATPAAAETPPPLDQELRPPTDLPDSSSLLPVAAAPSVRRLARELGVEIRAIRGGGPAGRISKEDVKAHVKALLLAPQTPEAMAGSGGMPHEELPDFSRWGEIEILPLSNVRRATARHLAKAWLLTPRVTQHDRADITELEVFRKRQQALLDKRADPPRLTMTAILIKVLARALQVFPQVNTALDLEQDRLIRRRYCHVGVAVDTERGLLVPVLRDVDRKGVLELARELVGLSARARERKSSPDELQGACITLTNLGGIGGTNFTPIVNHPEAAILGVSRSSLEPVWDEETGVFVPRLMLPLSLSYDHRIIDGADGARFTRWICEALESPMLMWMEG